PGGAWRVGTGARCLRAIEERRSGRPALSARHPPHAADDLPGRRSREHGALAIQRRARHVASRLRPDRRPVIRNAGAGRSALDELFPRLSGSRRSRAAASLRRFRRACDRWRGGALARATPPASPTITAAGRVRLRLLSRRYLRALFLPLD